MQFDSAAPLKIFSEALAPHLPNATLTGQRLSSGGLPICPCPAPTSPAVAAQRKAGLREAAGTTAPTEARQCQQPGAIRRHRAPATRAPVPLFDSARRNPYAQRTRPLAPDHAAPARRPVGLRPAPAAIGPRPAIAGRAIDFPHKPATCAHGVLNGSAHRGRSSAMASAMCRPSRRPQGVRCDGGREKQPQVAGKGQASRRTLPRSPRRASLRPAQSVRTPP